MDVFLVRHADAVDETLAIRDPARALTARGRAQARSLGDRLRWHDCEPTHAFTSPLVRTVQTAELVVAALGSQVVIDVEPALAPSGSAHAVVAALAHLPAEASVILFGHGPGLADVGGLLARDLDLPTLSRAEAIRISDGRVRWRFAWDADAPSAPR